MYWSASILAPDTSFFLAGQCYSYLKSETSKSQVSQDLQNLQSLKFLQRSLLSVCAHFRAEQGKTHQKIGRNSARGIKETHLFRPCLVTKLLVVKKLRHFWKVIGDCDTKQIL